MPPTDPAPARGDRLRRQGWAWYLVPAFLVVAAGAGLPRDGAWVATYLAGHALAIAAVLAAMLIHRPVPERPWRLLVLGLSVHFLGDVIGLPALAGLIPPLPYPSLADLLYLAGYGLIVAAMVAAAAARGALRQRGDLLDAAVLTLGLAILSYAVIIGPHVGADPDLTLAGRIVSIAHPLIDLALASVAAILLMGGLRPSPAAVLFGIYIVAHLVADTIYELEQASGTFVPSSVVTVLWPVSLAVLGAASLHPSMTSLAATEPEAFLPERWRVPIIGLAVLTIPVGLLIATATNPMGAAPIAVMSAVLFIVALVRLRGMAIDVEVSRRLVGELAGARARYRDLVERVPAIVFTDRIGPGGTSITEEYLSPQANEILGFEPDEVLADQHVWGAIIHPEDRERVATGYRDWVQAILSDPAIASTTHSDEYRVVASDDRVLWFREVARAVAGDDGRHDHVQGIILDITEQKAIQARIHALALRNELLLESVGEGIYGIDLEGRATFVNRAAAAILGYDPSDLVGQPMHPRIHDRRADGSPYPVEACPIYAALRDGSVHAVQDEVVWRKDGSSLDVEYTSTPVRDEGGSIAGAVVVFRDVTARKRADEAIQAAYADLENRVAERTQELEAARVEAERANRAKGEFLSSMSHDLRTPLNAILGFGQLLELSTLAERDRESLEQILRAGRQLLAMIDDVLEFTRVDSGRLTLAIEPIVVTEAVREAMDLVRTQAVERGVQLEWPSGADPGLAVLADRRRLVQVLLNLLVNAVKFSREGGTVTVAAEPLAEGRVRIIVRDTGIGISPERIPRIFEPVEVDSGGRSGSRSIGLGLVTGSRLARAMGGSIFVESQLGSGSTFSLDLPRAGSMPGPST